MLKSIIALLLSLSLLLTLIACGNQPAPQQTDSTPVASSEASAPSREEPQSTVDESVESAESTEGETTAQVVQNSESKEVSSILSAMQAETESLDTTKSPNDVTTQAEPILPTESSPSSETTSPLESVLSSEPSSSSSATSSFWDVTCYPYLPYNIFFGETTDELITWVKDQQASSQPEEITVDSTGAARPNLLVVKSAKEGLVGYGISIEMHSRSTYRYDFRTYESSKNQENQLFSITITPLSSSVDPWTNLINTSNEYQTGSYKGIEYAYVDGREKADQLHAIWATAWFVCDNHFISIQATWANAHKPWNNEWFDYFEFENIEL